MEQFVIKRNGVKDTMKRQKLDGMIDWAARNKPNLPLQILKDKMWSFCVPGIQTSILNQQLPILANSLVSIDEPDWRFVSAQFTLADMFKEAKHIIGYDHFGYPDYAHFVKLAVELGVYDDTILRKYSSEELNIMAKEINSEYDLGFDYAGMTMIANRYCLKYGTKFFELPQFMYMTVALLAAQNESKSSRLRWAKRFYHAFASRKLSPATPILLNLRVKDGNLASCFVLAIGDGLDDINYAFDQAAQISKNAGGVGINVSRIRAQGSDIRGIVGASKGPIPFVKILDDYSVAVDQLGSRKGAFTISMDVWHFDIEGLLEIQTENGDLRQKAFNIFPQVIVNDLFMRKYTAARDANTEDDWYVFCPHEVKKVLGYSLPESWGDKFEEIYNFAVHAAEAGQLKVWKKIPIRATFRHILQTAFETGLPYVVSKDYINQCNPNKHVGMIPGVNLCVESFSNFNPSMPGKRYIVDDGDGEPIIVQETIPGYVHTCNLVSPNISLLDTPEEEEEIFRLAVRVLDNLIDVATPPIPEAQMHNDHYRILGIGCMGLADKLAKNKVMYSESWKPTEGYTDRDGNLMDPISEMFERYAYYMIDESCNLSRERGAYKYFEGSDWQKGIFFGRNAKAKDFGRVYDQSAWIALADKVERYGIRNGGLGAIAPNTGTSLNVGCSASMLPVFSKFFIEQNGMIVTPNVAQFLNDDTFWYYQESSNVRPEDVINVVSRAQSWIDQGISMELKLNLKDPTMDAERLGRIYEKALNGDVETEGRRCKTVYYLRSKTDQDEEAGCVSCAN